MFKARLVGAGTGSVDRLFVFFAIVSVVLFVLRRTILVVFAVFRLLVLLFVLVFHNELLLIKNVEKQADKIILLRLQTADANPRILALLYKADKSSKPVCRRAYNRTRYKSTK